MPIPLTATEAGVDVCAHEAEHVNSEVCEGKLDADSVSALIAFFKLLDEWDREARPQ